MNKSSFNEGWKFRRKDTKGFVDVMLPHDAMIGEPRAHDAAGGTNTGWFAGNDYTYEKTFFVPEDWVKEDIVFEFEGVYRYAEVFINEKKAASRPYGYTGFYVQANEYLKYGGENIIRVEAKNADQPNSRWYSGAGIYRPVWLYQLPKEHIEINGIRITTKDYRTPAIQVEIETNGSGHVKTQICDGDVVIAENETETERQTRMEFVFPNAKLWDEEHPNLYSCRVTFGEDMREEIFGIRLIECDSRRGFCINGRRVIMRGACIHHDNGLLGAAAHPFAEERKIRLLKEAGYNAIRSAHNPCSKALLEACDKLGMLVLDEYVDMWYIHKTQYDYADCFEQWWKKDIKSMLEKDYNHPSVIMYSIGNEVSETAQEKGIALCEEMTKFIHLYDSRPVTCGINVFFNFLSSMGFGVYSDDKAKKEAERVEKQKVKQGKKRAVGSEFYNNLAGVFGSEFMKFGATLHGSDVKTREAFARLDVAGYNYGIKRYEKDLKKYPQRVILGSETFGFDTARFWNLAKKNPALIGDFLWTGIDYLGEVGIGAMEYQDYAPEFAHGPGWMTAGVGMLDLTGQTTGQMAYVQAAYEQSPVRIGVIPADHASDRHSPSAWRMSNAFESWAWNGCEGRQTKVEVYARGYKAALFLNGRKIGSKRLYQDCRTAFKVKWEPGTLTAVIFDETGDKIADTSLHSAGEQTKLTVIPENQMVGKDDLCYIRMKYTDEQGLLKPLARGDIRVEVEGGTLLALGNACPYNARGYLENITDTYYGEALAIIRPNGDNKIQVAVRSPFGDARVCVPCE